MLEEIELTSSAITSWCDPKRLAKASDRLGQLRNTRIAFRYRYATMALSLWTRMRRREKEIMVITMTEWYAAHDGAIDPSALHECLTPISAIRVLPSLLRYIPLHLIAF
jgi:hypothetical protein